MFSSQQHVDKTLHMNKKKDQIKCKTVQIYISTLEEKQNSECICIKNEGYITVRWLRSDRPNRFSWSHLCEVMTLGNIGT